MRVVRALLAKSSLGDKASGGAGLLEAFRVVRGILVVEIFTGAANSCDSHEVLLIAPKIRIRCAIGLTFVRSRFTHRGLQSAVLAPVRGRLVGQVRICPTHTYGCFVRLVRAVVLGAAPPICSRVRVIRTLNARSVGSKNPPFDAVFDRGLLLTLLCFHLGCFP